MSQGLRQLLASLLVSPLVVDQCCYLLKMFVENEMRSTAVLIRRKNVSPHNVHILIQLNANGSGVIKD